MSGLLSNAISGLQASQNALRTAGHNIANANTEGYSRQQVGYSTRPEQRLGSVGYMGSGVTTQSVERVVNQFVNAQLRTDTSAYHQLNAFDGYIRQVDKLFADMNTGMGESLQRFFAAMQNGADDPSSLAARQLAITEAESLSTKFNALHDRLADIESSINREVSAVTSEISSLAQSIGELNRSITEKSAAVPGGSPNDLLDKRDEALRKLSELVNIQVVQGGDGEMSVFIGNGQPLVIGNAVSRFSVSNDGQIMLSNNVHSADITGQLKGGKIGGLLEFRGDTLGNAKNELGRVAIALADNFNELQQQGVDLDGDYGRSMFRDINDPALAQKRIYPGNNALPNDRDLSLFIDDTSRLTTSDYRLQILPNTSNYAITRLSDGELVGQGALPGGYPYEIEFDGLRLRLDGGSFQGGDSFTLKPTVEGAKDIRAELSRPEDLAFALAIRTGSDYGNQGNGEISQGDIQSLYDANGNLLPAFANPGQLSPPVVIRFTSETTYEVLDNSDPENPVPLEPPIREQRFRPGAENAIFSSDPGETVIVGDGARLGLPEGRSPDVLASGAQRQPNGYPAEQLTFFVQDPDTGVIRQERMVTRANATAAQTAEQLSNMPGVSANAFTTASLTDMQFEDFDSPLQITLNGEALIPYDPDGDILGQVPNPNTDPVGFNDFLAEQINGNDNLKALGIRAESGTNPVTGRSEVRLVASSGVDLDVRLEADNPNNRLGVNDSNGNPTVRLEGQGAGSESQVTVGGRIDITLAEGIRLETAPTTSGLFGDSRADDFARSAYLGYQVNIKGRPQAGDTFTVDFNSDATNDNRNALRFAALETQGTVADGGKLSLSDAYGRLVETIGSKSSLSRINTQAAEGLMQQTQATRDSISGVNIDEEAANLIKFEQIYGANARVLTVARDLFNTLLNSI
ncbi:flagellar hook-associated protein FlgK [Marinimicrobium alkaliphilum]|uniref:flagellar hook-associated protein FlgK n=1 Tax=Marinimicrobium alkaliphilum TaxID=2202654 RepID=UPI000DBABF00|nr:flagellar hook-associated protein FlgK [Marinimicrobium alkaliphilum]